MENPFKEIGHPPMEAPKEMKKIVMENVNSFKLFIEMMSFFSLDYASAVEAFFKRKNKNF
ncbi:hypothetical protein EGM88_11135 [Aureibaculum marinum]|uniref:Uncharacterized protein n=1 Tax=Aureibaculum marinum TaxID=2487930 RepID=A0A3N4NHX2_9FLAO|nr:hypothetical protein [Aureibaculum marinum]RPD96012.1 hypothetical protein EGM88_11135 [Aureibaculum marinum]